MHSARHSTPEGRGLFLVVVMDAFILASGRNSMRAILVLAATPEGRGLFLVVADICFILTSGWNIMHAILLVTPHRKAAGSFLWLWMAAFILASGRNSMRAISAPCSPVLLGRLHEHFREHLLERTGRRNVPECFSDMSGPELLHTPFCLLA